MKPLSQKQIARFKTAERQYRAGEFQAVMAACRELLKRNPSHPDILFLLGRTQLRIRRPAEARATLERFLAVVPNVAEVHVMIGNCFRDEARFEESMRAIDRALAIRPSYPEAIAKKAELFHIMGDYQAGYDMLAPIVAKGEVNNEIRCTYGRLAGLLGHHEEAARAYHAVLDDPGSSHLLRTSAMFDIANLHDKLGEYPQAWEAAERANRMQETRFDPYALHEMIEGVVAAWTKEAIAELPQGEAETEQPVFIIGMLRSGTSMVEQILASHPDVEGGGERPTIFKISDELQPSGPFEPAHIDDLSVLTPRAVARSARRYLKDIRTVSRTAARITDKQPFNFLYLGLIAQLFPRARIIHCVREPLDVAVSCFFQSFLGTVGYAQDIEHIALFYLAYRRLMKHWPSVLDLNMIEVSYEELVAEQEAVSRRLVDFLGLEWDDACLRFHESTRVSWTASIDQVRKKVHDSSVGRWRHYAAQLRPLLALLQRANVPTPSPEEIRRILDDGGGTVPAP